MPAANQAEFYTIELIKDLATEFFSQPVTVLTYNYNSKKMGSIFALPEPVTPKPASASPATDVAWPSNPLSSGATYDYARTRSYPRTSTRRLLGIKSAHRTRSGALEALLEALEQAIGQSMHRAPVETASGYIVQRDWIL